MVTGILMVILCRKRWVKYRLRVVGMGGDRVVGKTDVVDQCSSGDGKGFFPSGSSGRFVASWRMFTN